MKEYFVITDVHSFFTIMMDSLKERGFDIDNPDHIIISCGDNFDRGPEAKEMLKFLVQLFNKDRLIPIKGNHDDLFQDMISNGYPSYIDKSNGTYDTYRQLKSKDDDIFDDMRNYNHQIDMLINNSLNYYETKQYIFVHGWIPAINNGKMFSYDPGWRSANKEDFRNARWYNGMQMATEYGVIEPNKTIICGHWHCSWGNVRRDFPGLSNYDYRELENDKTKFEPFEDKGIIAFDACTAYTKKCNILHFFENEL